MVRRWQVPPCGSAFWWPFCFVLRRHFPTPSFRSSIPGAGSSYFFAEQAFLSKTHAFKFARLAKFIIGWASHLYYWVYPGLMVGVTAVLVGFFASQFWPNTFNGSIFSPTLMIVFCILFSIGVSYIAYRGVSGSTGVAIAINIIQISALLVFSVIALGYRVSHGEGSVGWTLDPDGNPINVVLALDKDGNPIKDEKTGAWQVEQENGKDKPLILNYAGQGVIKGAARSGQARRRYTANLPVSRNGRLGDCAAQL